MPKGDTLGEFEQIVLIALLRLDNEAYGMSVRREIQERTGRSVSIGAVYATLERLEAKSYVSSFVGDATAERGGRAKRFFRIESDGKRALKDSQDTLRKMLAGLKVDWRTI
ncbi:MAG TPA: helix-turn-helix transcriptional regulator [Bryobacteraceae bacterium]|nr:helix-turn-helix transcriptional regulator [Bryobacteraceae bacterium]